MPPASDEQLVLDGLAAWNRGEWEAALGMLHPDIEWRISQPLFDMPMESHGREGVRAFWEQWTEIWDEIHIEVERTVPIADGVAAFIRWRARGRDGVEVDQQVVFAFTIEHGKTRRFVAFWDPAEAVKELGLEDSQSARATGSA